MKRTRKKTAIRRRIETKIATRIEEGTRTRRKTAIGGLAEVTAIEAEVVAEIARIATVVEVAVGIAADLAARTAGDHAALIVTGDGDLAAHVEIAETAVDAVHRRRSRSR